MSCGGAAASLPVPPTLLMDPKSLGRGWVLESGAQLSEAEMDPQMPCCKASLPPWMFPGLCNSSWTQGC